MRWLSLDLKEMPITTLDDLYDYYDFSLNESRTTDSWTCLRSTFKPHYISESNLNLNLVGGPYRFLINLIMFLCKYCAERFTALFARGLTQHCRKCQAFLKHEAKANQCWKTTIASNKNRWTNLWTLVKLVDCKAHLGYATPGVSFFFFFDNQKISWLIGISRNGSFLDQVRIIKKMSFIMWSTRQWINNFVLSNSCHLHFLFHYQHLHHLPLLHNPILASRLTKRELSTTCSIWGL